MIGILFFFSLITANNSWSYPQFIGHGYKNCMACHYNPAGNGPLTDYGRGVGATTIAGNVFTNQSLSELDKQSSFLFGMFGKNNWVKPSLDYRGARLIRNYGNAENEKSYTIHMQADANLVLTLNQKNSVFVSGSIGHREPPLGRESTEGSTISREHYLGIRPWEVFGVYIGLFDKVFGVRVPDHTAFSKGGGVGRNVLGQNDQSYGVMLNAKAENLEVFLHNFVAGEDRIAEHFEGFSAMGEYTIPNTEIRPGVSYLSSEGTLTTTELNLMALHARVGILKGSSMLFEFGQRNSTARPDPTVGAEETKSQYFFNQNFFLVSKGFYFLTTLENYVPDTEVEASTWRFGPGFQWFPYQALELRFEVYNTRQRNSTLSTSVDDNWDVLAQVHLWL